MASSHPADYPRGIVAVVTRRSITDCFIGAAVVALMVLLGPDGAALNHPSANSGSADNLLGLVMQVGGALAALVLAPLGIVIAMSGGVRLKVITHALGQDFGRAALRATEIGLASAGSATVGLAMSDGTPSPWWVRVAVALLIAAFLAVFHVAKDFASFLQARALDEGDPIDTPYESSQHR